MKGDVIRTKILSVRMIPNVDPMMAKALGLSDDERSLGLITTDCDDVSYAALDEATKKARVRVAYAKSMYAGASNASTALAGEFIGILAAADPAEAHSGLDAAVNYIEKDAHFISANEDGSIVYFAHCISRSGTYLSGQADVPEGTAIAYLIAPPIEAMVGLDEALKKADTKLRVFYGPPSETNFAGGLLSGDQAACKAACEAFADAVCRVAQMPVEREGGENVDLYVSGGAQNENQIKRHTPDASAIGHDFGPAGDAFLNGGFVQDNVPGASKYEAGSGDYISGDRMADESYTLGADSAGQKAKGGYERAAWHGNAGPDGDFTPKSMPMAQIPRDDGGPVYVDHYTGQSMHEKPENMTHLRGNELVYKDHPQISFRGMLDSLQAQIIHVQVLADARHRGALVEGLSQMLEYVRRILSAEVLDEPLEDIKLLGMDSAQLRYESHNIPKIYGISHPMPDYRMGELCAELNLLRTKVRECELSAVKAFSQGDICTRTDIVEALNRLSSFVYILFCREYTGKYQV